MLLIIIIILIFSSAFAQEYNFTYEPLGIPVEMASGDIPVSPWIGGVFHAAPTLADIDADGDYDLFVGNGPGYILYYENTGTPDSAVWSFVTEEYDSIWAGIGIGISNFTLAKPVFADLDNDQDLDLYIGAESGKIIYYSNQGTSSNPIWQYETNYWDSIYVVMDANPQFCDIDGDNDKDLFIGDFQAHLHFYENIGTIQCPEFIHITDQFFENMIESRKTPHFIDIDNDNDYDCFVGGYYGRIHYFRNEGDSVVYDFEYVTDNYMGIDVGDYSVPYFCDIDDDGDYDLFVGEGGNPTDYTPSLGLGDVNYYENIGNADSADFELRNENMLSLDVEMYCYTSFCDIDTDEDLDLFVGELAGNYNLFRNTGTSSEPNFVFETEFWTEQYFGWQNHGTFGDIDADGDFDLVVGGGIGFTSEVALYENIGTPEEPEMVLQSEDILGETLLLASPFLVDIDYDNDLDLFVGELEDADGHVRFYRNIGDSTRYDYALENDNLIGSYDTDMLPCLYDIDDDDDYDLFVGENNRILYFENTGSPFNFNFTLVTDTFANIYNTPGACYPNFADIDGDDDYDLFIGEIDGGLRFYRNVTVGVNDNPSSINPITFSLQNPYPNPFNASTTIRFTLDRALPVRVVVYNGLGQHIETLIDGRMSSGQHVINWNASKFSSGIYLITLESNIGFQQTRKVILVK